MSKRKRHQRTKIAASGAAPVTERQLDIGQILWNQHRGYAYNHSNVAVNDHTVLGLTAVWCAVNVLANSLASLGVGVYERDGFSKIPVHDDPINDILNVTPDGETTAIRFKQAQWLQVFTRGNSYSEIEFGLISGKPLALHLSQPGHIRPTRDSKGKLWYEQESGPTLPPRKVLHFAGLGWDGVQGYSPVTIARETLGLGLVSQEFAARLYGSGHHINGIIEIPGKLSPDAMDKLRVDLAKLHQGPDGAGSLAIFEQGMKFNPTSFAPKDAEFLASRQFQVVEVSRLYNVPPHKLHELGGATFSNVEELNIDFYQSSLMPWVEMAEQEYNLKLLGQGERRSRLIESNLRTLLRGNAAARSAMYTTLWNMGALTPNEVRAYENMNPIPGGDRTFVQVNMAPIASEQPQEQPPAELPEESPQPQPVDASTDRATEAVRAVVAQAVSRLVTRECKAIRHALKRPESLVSWVDDYYVEHHEFMRGQLAPVLTAYAAVTGLEIDADNVTRDVVDTSRAKLLEVAKSCIEESDLIDSVGRLLDTWEQEKTGEIVSTLEVNA